MSFLILECLIFSYFHFFKYIFFTYKICQSLSSLQQQNFSFISKRFFLNCSNGSILHFFLLAPITTLSTQTITCWIFVEYVNSITLFYLHHKMYSFVRQRISCLIRFLTFICLLLLCVISQNYVGFCHYDSWHSPFSRYLNVSKISLQLTSFQLVKCLFAIYHKVHIWFVLIRPATKEWDNDNGPDAKFLEAQKSKMIHCIKKVKLIKDFY